MPEENLEDALAAATELKKKSIETVFTRLGENIRDRSEAARVSEHYKHVLGRARDLDLGTEISVKLTQLGLDLDPDLCYEHLVSIIESAGKESTVWIDMEAHNYVDVTLELYRCARRAYPNVGICLQRTSTGRRTTWPHLCPWRLPSAR